MNASSQTTTPTVSGTWTMPQDPADPAPIVQVRPMSFLRFCAYGVGFLVVLAVGIVLALAIAAKALAWLA